MEKVSLKTNYFQFWVDWDQLLFCDFWDFFRRCKKIEKVRLKKFWVMNIFMQKYVYVCKLSNIFEN